MELTGVMVLSLDNVVSRRHNLCQVFRRPTLSAAIPKGTWGKLLSLHRSSPSHSRLGQTSRESAFAQPGTDEPTDLEKLEIQAMGRNKGQ